MRASPAMREAERKKCEARVDRIREINRHLAERNCRVCLRIYGAGAAMIHLDYEAAGEYAILDTYTDVDFDQTDLADSKSIRDRCLIVDAAVDVLKPLIEEKAVAGFKAKFRELMA